MPDTALHNHSLLFWCCKPLGLRCFEFLMSVITEKYADVQVKGIIISSTDETAPDIEAAAMKYGIPIFDETTPIPFKVDVGLCIGFPLKLSSLTIQKCRHGLINLHFAPLPHYRGSGTLTHAIINGEKKYGLTFHYMDEELDTGDVIAVKWMDLSGDETALTIIKKLETLGYAFFQEYCEKILQDQLPATPQSQLIAELQVTPRFCTRKSVKNLYELSLEWPFEKIDLYLRALTLGKPAKPFFKKGDKKIYLSLSE